LWLKTFEAAFPADLEVVLFRALVWERALPADVLDFFPVDLLLNVLEAAEAALRPVTLLLGMRITPSPKLRKAGYSLSQHLACGNKKSA